MNIYNVLWENVEALTVKRFGAYTRNKVVKDSKEKGHPISTGTLQRIESKNTSVGIDVIAEIAQYFKVQPSQLLISGAFNESDNLVKPEENKRHDIMVGTVKIPSRARLLVDLFNKLSEDHQHYVEISIQELYKIDNPKDKKADPYPVKPKKVKNEN